MSHAIANNTGFQCRTLGVRRGWKRERSGRWKPSPAPPCSAEYSLGLCTCREFFWLSMVCVLEYRLCWGPLLGVGTGRERGHCGWRTHAVCGKLEVVELGEAGYTPSKTTDDPFEDIFLSDANTQVTETLAQYPSGTWKYWETVEAE